MFVAAISAATISAHALPAAAVFVIAGLPAAASLLTLLIPAAHATTEAGAITAAALLLTCATGEPLPFGLAAAGSVVFGVARERAVRRVRSAESECSDQVRSAPSTAVQELAEDAGLDDDHSGELHLGDIPGEHREIDTDP